MTDDLPALERRPLLERLAGLLMRVPEDREQLLELLRQSHDRSLLDADALAMIEGVMQVSELTAADVMVPRTQMDVLEREAPFSELIAQVIETAHSRFPVIEGDRDNIVGILHSKDLLRLQIDPDARIADLVRPALFIPESKRLNVLLREFRDSHEHLAIVVDEYGGTAGLLTIEDVLEQIVGDIEDEFDIDEEADHIIEVSPANPESDEPQRWRVRAITELAHFNGIVGSMLADDDVDTIGGLVVDRLGRVPLQGESIEIDGLRFEVLHADPRQIDLLLVERLPAEAPGDPDSEGA